MHQRALAERLEPQEAPARPEPAPLALLHVATPATVIGMQRTAGNVAVQRYIKLSRQETRADADISEAIADRDIGAIKDIDDFSAASDVQRLQMIEILLDQFWVGPYDEAALERIWASFGARLPAMMATHARLWWDCTDRGAELSRWTRWDNLNLTCEIQPGVISDRQASRAAAAVEELEESDYLQFRQLMYFAGSGMQLAFICKALAAGRSIGDIATFANTIRGKPDTWLQQNLSIVAWQTPEGSTSQTGVMQQWQMACGPTNVQILQAENDPIFALSLTSAGPINDQSQSNAPLTSGQGTILQGHGSTPTPVGTAGTGAWVEDDMNALEDSTGVTYTYTAVTATFPTNAAGSSVDQAVDGIVAFLDRDLQVPIVIGGATGNATNPVATAHYVMCLRAEGDRILVHDPGNGSTAWVTRAQFLGNTLAPPLSWPALAGYDRPSES
jgi:hypothetical protein